MLRKPDPELFFGGILTLAMWLTRSHAIAPELVLPDTTWASFFLAGFCSRRHAVPTALLANAAIIDYVAVVHGGVSADCYTPAYAFLIPTYLALWIAGRNVSAERLTSLASLRRCGLRLAAGVAAAFAISNAGFFAFSGHFDSMSFGAYLSAVARYLPGYLESTALYAALGIAYLSLRRNRDEARWTRPLRVTR